jgi:hypothetical protein
MADNYLRVCRLIVQGRTYSLDDMQVEFIVRQKRVSTPAIAEIRVLNLSDSTKNTICRQNQSVILEAGYRDHYGAIFKGTIKQGNRGKINGTDTYMDLFCGDGDQAYIKAQVIKTIAKGSTRQDVVNECLKAFAPYGITKGFMSPKLNDGFKYPQDVPLFGLARDIMRKIAKDVGADWSFNSGKLNVVHKAEALPGGDIVLNSNTGMIGRATQTFNGIIVRTNINPSMYKDRVVKIDEGSIDRAAPDPAFGYNNPSNATLPSIAADGRYRVYGVDRTGSMRSNEWYDTLYCAAANGSGFLPKALMDFQQ